MEKYVQDSSLGFDEELIFDSELISREDFIRYWKDRAINFDNDLGLDVIEPWYEKYLNWSIIESDLSISQEEIAFYKSEISIESYSIINKSEALSIYLKDKYYDILKLNKEANVEKLMTDLFKELDVLTEKIATEFREYGNEEIFVLFVPTYWIIRKMLKDIQDYFYSKHEFNKYVHNQIMGDGKFKLRSEMNVLMPGKSYLSLALFYIYNNIPHNNHNYKDICSKHGFTQSAAYNWYIKYYEPLLKKENRIEFPGTRDCIEFLEDRLSEDGKEMAKRDLDEIESKNKIKKNRLK